jgi:hypothetical protein
MLSLLLSQNHLRATSKFISVPNRVPTKGKDFAFREKTFLQSRLPQNGNTTR